MAVLDEVIAKMHTENYATPSKQPIPKPRKPRRYKTIRADGVPLTGAERVARSNLKKKLVGAVLGPGGGGLHGGLERISDIVIREGRKGLQPTVDKDGKVIPPRLQVTVRDALLAEKLVDSREGKIDDRRAMLAIAVALTGGGLEPPPEMLALPDGNTIDGEFEELDD